MKFTKMQGTGNDFIIIEDFDEQIKNLSELAIKMCDRHLGIGADGLIIVAKSKIADIKMLIINSDGSYASMCGNGIRCFSKYVWDKDIVKKDIISVETGDGIKIAYINQNDGKVSSVKINMGKPSFDPKDIPALSEKPILNNIIIGNNKKYKINSLRMGVPHTVIIGKHENYDVYEGKAIETHKLFPENTNVNFCEVANKGKIKVKTWERGAGPTMACGTGSCASVVVCNKLGLINSKAIVEVPGGELFIELEEDGVFMTGPAVISFTGEYILYENL